ncbi:MAG: hypothetical protein IPP83_13260 [Flavobacteriales bacterium]|nr:hypothetical protein [Flavobacteriales bacterium]
MSTDAMKLELIEWLTKLKEPSVIASLFNWKKASEAEDWYATLSAEQKASIDRGSADASAGRTISSEEIRKQYGRAPKG